MSWSWFYGFLSRPSGMVDSCRCLTSCWQTGMRTSLSLSPFSRLGSHSED